MRSRRWGTPMPKLPGPLSYGAMILGAVREGESKAEKRPIIFCGQAESIEPLRSRLVDGAAEGTRAVELYAMRRLQPDDRKQLARAEVVVYGGTVVSGLDNAPRPGRRVVARSARPKLALLEALELPNPAITQA